MKNVSANDAVLNKILGLRKIDNNLVSEEKQREGFQFGSTYVVGKTYEEFLAETKVQSLRNDKLRELYEIMYL